MELRRLVLLKDRVYLEGGLPAYDPVTRVVACGVIANPFAGRPSDDLRELFGIGAALGELLVHEAIGLLPGPAIAYGKACVVGVAGDIEHAAAVLHPGMGAPIRAAIGGGLSIIPSNAKVAAAGTEIDVPLGHKDDVWSFDHIDTISVAVPGAPRPDELVVILVLSDGGRPRPRIKA
jgi:hypothetical protein